jgi:hypothetical protein
MTAPRNPWLRIGLDAWSMGFEASAVIGLRALKIAAGVHGDPGMLTAGFLDDFDLAHDKDSPNSFIRTLPIAFWLRRGVHLSLGDSFEECFANFVSRLACLAGEHVGCKMVERPVSGRALVGSQFDTSERMSGLISSPRKKNYTAISCRPHR